MEVNELRIGNLVKCSISNDAAIYAVWGISYSGISLSGTRDGELIPHNKIKPIPLTEEWLLNQGFKNKKPFLFFSKKHYQVDFLVFSWETPVGQSNGVPAGEFYIIINGTILVLSKVHQLQNLFFALTGEELNTI